MLYYKKIIKKLIKKNITISICESCTGGLVCSKFISYPGISNIFNMGLITYSNKSKSSLLKINPNNLKKYGAVSNKIATLMVLNLKKISKSKLCISTTGIAGPKGGSKSKPVGLVYIGLNYKNKILIIKKYFKGSRNQIQNNAVKTIFKQIEKLI